MKQYNLQDGDLELLALGMLSAERQEIVLAALYTNAELQTEYDAIQDSLLLLAEENAITAPENLKPNISKAIEVETGNSVFKSLFKNPIFRMAASVLLVGSVLANIYFLQNKTTEVVESQSTEEIREGLGIRFLAELPFEEALFEDMFNYLEHELDAHPCMMTYQMSKAFLAKHDLDTAENIEFLKEHGAHCDCEVLMNLSRRFPKEPYHHGAKPPTTHQSAHIKLAYFQTSSQGPLLAFDMGTMRFRL